MCETNPPQTPDEHRDDAESAPAVDCADTLRETLEETERERDQFRAMALRAQADLVNYRRRAEDERETLKRNLTSSLLIDMLELVDDFDRALGYVPDDAVAPQWLEGPAKRAPGLRPQAAVAGSQQGRVRRPTVRPECPRSHSEHADG